MSKQAITTSKPWSGWLYSNPDTGTELSTNHPIRSGECPSATDIRAATREALRDELIKAQAALAERQSSAAVDQTGPATSETEPPPASSTQPLDDLAVRQIMADVDRVTVGRRRIDIAHALLTIVGQEVASNASSFRELKGRAYQVAKDLKTYARAKWAERGHSRVAG